MTATRRKHHWNVKLTDNAGRTVDVTFSSYWDPEKTDPEVIGKAAAIQHSREAGKDYVYTEVTNID